MEQLTQLLRALKRRILATSLAILVLVMFFSLTAHAQEFAKMKKRSHHAYYRKNENKLARACNLLKKKRNHVPRKSIFASHHRPRPNTITASQSVLTIDKTAVTADAVKTKPALKQLPIQPKTEHISEKKLETLHKKEDEVLALNHLPVPSSQKHEAVRQQVASKLASKVNVYPLSLAPLYFQFNQDEFSVVDMEPFLMAAEYALQGRTLLIEGHTDSRGQDDFNVKLSIKRVQKIRQLMLDMGVPDDRISVVGYGEEHSKDKNNEDEHQLSRRVDFTIF